MTQVWPFTFTDFVLHNQWLTNAHVWQLGLSFCCLTEGSVCFVDDNVIAFFACGGFGTGALQAS